MKLKTIFIVALFCLGGSILYAECWACAPSGCEVFPGFENNTYCYDTFYPDGFQECTAVYYPDCYPDGGGGGCARCGGECINPVTFGICFPAY